MTVVAFLIFPAKTNNFNVESLRGHAVTKSLRDTINEIQQKMSKQMYEVCLRYASHSPMCSRIVRKRKHLHFELLRLSKSVIVNNYTFFKWGNIFRRAFYLSKHPYENVENCAQKALNLIRLDKLHAKFEFGRSSRFKDINCYLLKNTKWLINDC